MAMDKVLEVTDIMEILPHRYPMLLVDRIIELEPMKYAVGIKNSTFDELFYQGHSRETGYAGCPLSGSDGSGRRCCTALS